MSNAEKGLIKVGSFGSEDFKSKNDTNHGFVTDNNNNMLDK